MVLELLAPSFNKPELLNSPEKTLSCKLQSAALSITEVGETVITPSSDPQSLPGILPVITEFGFLLVSDEGSRGFTTGKVIFRGKLM
jgi:hypothetical protein